MTTTGNKSFLREFLFEVLVNYGEQYVSVANNQFVMVNLKSVFEITGINSIKDLTAELNEITESEKIYLPEKGINDAKGRLTGRIHQYPFIDSFKQDDRYLFVKFNPYYAKIYGMMWHNLHDVGYDLGE